MADVFISYSRADGIFVRELHDFLIDRGKDVWVDWEDIPPASEWEEDIDDSIDAAESFVFVVSGSSLASRYSLGELTHAQERGKRIVPIACNGADPNRAPEGLRQLNWIWCRPTDERSPAFEKLLKALDTDLVWSELHTRLLVRAVEWDERRDSSLLLRGRDLEDATEGVAANAGKEPVPTDLQREYLLASRRASRRRQRLVLGSVSFALVVAIALALVALVQRDLANDRARTARSQALAAEATAALDSDPVSALADSVRALETDSTTEARLALRRALLANPVEYSVAAEGTTRRGARPDALTFSDGGRALAGLGPDGVLRVRDSRTGRERFSLPAASFAANGRLLVAARPRAARVVDVRTGEDRRGLDVPRGNRIVGVGISRGVARAAVAADGAIVLEQIPTGRSVTLAQRPSAGLRALFAARATTVVTFGRGAATRVWETGSGRLLATLPEAEDAVVSRDGRFVATISPAGDATLWSAGSRARIAHLTDGAESIALSPDGRLVVAAGEDGAAGVWSTATGKQLAALPGFGGLDAGFEAATTFSSFSPGAAFSDDGRLVALANADGTVRVWEVRTRQQVGSVAAGWANALAVAPHGARLAAMAWNGELVVARSPAGIAIRTGFRPSSCAPDFDPVLSGDGTRLLVRTAAGAGLWTLDGRRLASLTPPARPAEVRGNVASAAVNGDGTVMAAAGARNGCIVAAGEAHTTAVWRLGRGRPVRVLPPGSPVALDEGGRLLAAGGALWPTDGGPRVRGLGTVRVLGPDGRRALVDRQGRLEIAATATGEALAALHGADPLRRAFAEELASGSFSPDGERLLVRQDDRAGLWDATSGEPIARLGARGDTVEALAFGDGGRLALATVSTRAAVYSSADGKLVRAVEGSFARGAISPDGLLAAVPRGDGSLDVVDLVTGARTTLGTDTAAALTSVLFGPTSDLLVARDEAGDVHVVGCEICAPEEELLALARSRLAEVTRIEASRPPVSAIG